MQQSSWMSEAACKDKTEYFFIDHLPASQARKLEVVAKSICSSCKVRIQCLQYAVENDEQYGIWGGIKAKDIKFINFKVYETGEYDGQR